MTGMNRLSPLIVRDLELTRPRSGQVRALTVPVDSSRALPQGRPAEWLENLKLFATGWIGGLIFFGTLFS